MERQYEISDSTTKYIMFQRTGYLTLTNSFFFRAVRKLIPSFNYKRMVGLEAKLKAGKVSKMYLADMKKEYQSIKKFLPDDCSKILDIGCGVAGIDIFLNQHYLNKDVNFYLLDKSHIEEKVYYMYEEKGAFYNSLNIAKQTLVNNGVKKNNVHLIEATPKNDIKIDNGIDLVLSLISWGFHYPVNIYLEKVYKLLGDGGTLILDIRKDTEGFNLLTQKFGKYKIILETSKYLRVCATK
ncbi:MAG: hypothetical protein GY710_08745 [Desulfobacteraceae bacterium]|nr:hypothetical protein [Desulfobacteraceae bacterium]